MAQKKIFTVPFRRKRLGKTDYKKRLGLLKSKTLRLVVRRSNKHIVAQLVKYADKGDVIINSVSSNNLKKYGWDKSTGSIPAAYLVGLLIGKMSKGQVAILDLGLQIPVSGSRLYAVLKGAVDSGLKINYSEEVIPTEDRLSGKHISDDVSKAFEKVKQKILND